MSAYKLSIISPQGKAYEGEAESFSTTGREGEFGVLAGHTPMLAMLKPGISKITAGGQATYLVTGEGYCEVTRDAVNVLVDTAIKSASLDEARAALVEHLKTVGK